MLKKTITFLYMTKSYRNISKDNGGVFDRHIRDVLDPKNTLPFTVSNYFDIMSHISFIKSSYCINYVFLVSKGWMQAFCGDRTIGKKEISKNFNILYTPSSKEIKALVKKSSLVIFRGNYAEWNNLLWISDCKYIFLPCWSKIDPNRINVNIPKDATTVLVDDYSNRDSFLNSGYKSQIFKKPAMNIYYQGGKDAPKDIDICFICSNTNRKHKRFDLFFEGLKALDKISDRKLKVSIVGNSLSHSKKINSINLSNIKIEQAFDGKRTKRENIASILDRSKLSVCTSDVDANPRIIVESLAKNVPVLCPSDLAGGKFQINKNTGVIFSPNPQDLAEKIQYCLGNLDKFSPKKYCTKINTSANQFLSVLGDLRDK